MAAANAKQTSEMHTYNNGNFISDQCKDPDLKVQTIQKKEESRRKRKMIKKMTFQRMKAVTKSSTMIN